MTSIDWGLVAVLVISAALSLRRGFVKEALSLVSWIAAFFIAKIFSGNLASLLENYIETPSVRWIVAFAALFIGTIIIGAMINHLIVEMIRITGLSSTDRILGMVFGFARGLIIIVAIVYGLQSTAVPQDPWWQDSTLMPHLVDLADWAEKTLPGATERVTSYTNNL